ncbi:MAG: hypothetical protein CVV16_04130 [Gammaproteobacteria bacterium HGW-Gammaproteobacteria-6]|nr:MAG: hypothetical protein CVV16_04130 [Gammaproteobacteria bacterium HGW-Gammaproteobacteria-6]
MRILMLPITLTAALMSASIAMATDVEHYQGASADTLEQALANVEEYNKRLATLLQGELDNTALTEVHELTYTLENALEKIRDEGAVLAARLEDVHKASERYDAVVVKQQGDIYLDTSRALLNR